MTTVPISRARLVGVLGPSRSWRAQLCEPFCDLSMPNTCQAQGRVCNPRYMPDEAPEGFENVGFYAVPT